MLNKFFAAIGLGVTFDIASLLNADTISNALGKNTTVTERGFPFSYLEEAESTIGERVPNTEIIFSNATYNLIFWIVVGFIVVYSLFWILAKFTKIAFVISIVAVLSGFIFLTVIV